MGRILTFTKEDRNLVFSGNKLPTATLYPEAENKFFLTAFDIQFEFIKDDSLVVTANGKIDCTAKKIQHHPLVRLPMIFWKNILEHIYVQNMTLVLML